MRRYRFALSLIAASFLILSACSDSDSGPAVPFLELIQPERAAEVLDAGSDDLVLLDIRTPDEFNQARLSDAVNIDYYAADFRENLSALDLEATYVVYCRTGNRSASAVQIMQELGFQRVYEIDGGIARWYESGLPLE